MSFFSCNAINFFSMNNQEFRIRPQITDISNTEPLFYPYSIKEWNKNTSEARHTEWHETYK